MKPMAKKKRTQEPQPQSHVREKPGEEVVADEKAKTAEAPGWRTGLDFIGMLGAAVVVALLIKAYAFDVYVIPSGSMETALHGRPDGGDRIFCSKYNYRFRAPERWEVAVFKFPYETARLIDPEHVQESYKGQNFVKRVVGLPGESLALSRGDVWVRNVREGEGSPYRRVVKPDSVQRGMWLNVYEESFGDVSLQEFESFWKIIGGSTELRRGGPLVLAAGGESVRMDYRPLVPAGSQRDQMVELPGIPDRYVLEQPVQFRCRNAAAEGGECGHIFTKSVWTQNIQGRCPRCDSLQDETSVVFYHRRSGLPAVGRYGVNSRYAPQGEYGVKPREADYHLVPDLRVATTAVLEKNSTEITLVLREDSRFVQAVLAGDGRVEIQINGEASRVENRAVSGIRPGRRHTLEFYVVEGTARLFVDGEMTLEAPVWNDRRVQPRNVPRASGVALVANGGEVRLEKLAIDRDVFYYSGKEYDRGERFAAMSAQGEVFVGEESFFPMGDHGPSSYDARSWGGVPLSQLRGPALLVWWPPERIGMIPRP